MHLLAPLLHSIFSPPPPSPPPRLGEGGGGEKMLLVPPAALRGCGSVSASVGVPCGPAMTPRRPSLRVGPLAVPSTCYRVRLQACGTPKHEPTPRTNGALAGSPGGTTAARPDHSWPDPLARPGPWLSSRHGVALRAPHAPHTVAPAAAPLAWRRAVESTSKRQSFSCAPAGNSPCSR